MRVGFLWPLACLAAGTAQAQNAAVTVAIDASAGRHAISPLIYGVAFAGQADLAALNAPVNRSGGNRTTTYGWQASASNTAADYYFESYPDPSGTPGSSVDGLVAGDKAAGSASIVTIPLIGWVARLGANRTILPSFSVAKYGAQCAADPYDSDAGDGLRTDCSTPLTGNDPADAYSKDSVAAERAWVRHLVSMWGHAKKGGVGYYAMDNEASIWFSVHRDVHPVGAHATEYRDDVIAMAAKVHAADPGAKVMAPEEWGWDGYLYDGYDQQYAPSHGWQFPDHAGLQGGVDYIPWLLAQWKAAGHPVDVVSVHFYPQGGEYSNDTSAGTDLLRNRSTRQLWDPNYVSESWINTQVQLIPRLKGWVANSYYPGTPVAITEYNWGAEGDINGATAQADIYGIFGQQGLDMATRWTVPASGTPTYKAMQMYRNYDGVDSTFGDTSVQAAVPNPDDLSAFAALRAKDGALTVMVVAKVLGGTTPVSLALGHFTASGTAQRYQLTAANTIQALPALAWSGGALADTVPAQSITLYVLPK